MSLIVLTGGGTAGHCIPHLAILPYLHNSFDNICYIGSENGIENKLMASHTDYFSIPTVKFFRRFTLKNLLIPFKLFTAIKSAKKILKKLKPDVIFSKGGYVALPVCLAAFALKIPVVCHESDFTLGLANRLTAKKADWVLTTFSDTALSVKNGCHVGSPIRENLFYADRRLALKKFGFDSNKPVLLVFGGSSGSLKINKALEKSLAKLLEKYYVLHICGRGNKPNDYPRGYFCTEFLEDMASAYKISTLAVSRGGSNAISELIAQKIPTLVIPLGTGASRGDQIQNAEYYKKKGLCECISDDNLNDEKLLKGIERLSLNSSKIAKNLANTPSIVGNRKIADLLAKYADIT